MEVVQWRLRLRDRRFPLLFLRNGDADLLLDRLLDRLLDLDRLLLLDLWRWLPLRFTRLRGLLLRWRVLAIFVVFYFYY